MYSRTLAQGGLPPDFVTWCRPIEAAVPTDGTFSWASFTAGLKLGVGTSESSASAESRLKFRKFLQARS